MNDQPPLTYAAAGVDLDAAEEAVARIARLVGHARRAEVVGDIGGFGGLFAFDPGRWRRPLLVSAADGVGTKVELARRLGRLDTIGIDLVAMVVDDIVTTGAEPLFLNDYLVVGRLDPDRVERIVAGIVAGCAQAGCALVGGETAEHPGLLDPDEFDLAGFGVGVVEQERLLGAHRVRAGDALVAMASSGLHANGFSLVRRIVADLDLDAEYGLGAPLGEVLLTPTRIYAPACLALCAAVDVHALCHITGGGLPGNLPRVLPEGLGVVVDTATWSVPAVFGFLAERGAVPPREMWRTFNQGVGMVAVVAPEAGEAAVEVLAEHGIEAWVAGEVVAGPGVQLL